MQYSLSSNNMKSKILKNTVCMLFCLCIGFFQRSYCSLNYMPSILDQFKICHPIIINTLIDANALMSIVKCMSSEGQQINFNQNGIDLPYQSYLIFTKLRNFTWNSPTYAPILVVSRIENENDLNKADVSIGSEVLFLDWFSLKVYESYTVNEIKVTRYLGQFQENKIGKHRMIFVQSKDYTFSMEKRRDNFFGLNIKMGTTRFNLPKGISGPAEFPKEVIFFPNNNTYDVTNLLTNSKNKHSIFMSLEWMETKFNFTAKLFLRKDMKYGSPTVSPNGSVILGDGVFRDMFEGSVDFICDKMVMLPERTHFGTFLPPIYIKHDAIYIPIMDSNEYLDWTVFFGPLSTKLWIAIILKCIIFSFFVYVVEWFHNYKLVSFDVMN